MAKHDAKTSKTAVGQPSREALEELITSMRAQAGPGTTAMAIETYRQRMAGWDRSHVADLLAWAAYDVRNAWLGARLNLAIHAAAGLFDTDVRPAAKEVKAILDKGGEGTAKHLEDPLEGPYVWQVRLRHSHRFICAPLPEDVFYLSSFWKAAEQLPGEAGQRVRDALVTVGTISEAAAKRAGLPRVAGPGRSSSGQIHFPAAALTDEHREGFYVNEQEIENTLERPQDAATYLAGLCTTWEEIAASSFEDTTLLTRPLVKDAEGWRLVSPHYLPRAAMAAALRTARNAGVLDEYRELTRHGLVQEAITWCGRLGWMPVDRRIRSSDVDDMTIAATPFWTSQRAAMHVVVVSHVPSEDVLEDPDQAPTLELPGMAGQTGLSTMLADARFDPLPDRHRQLFVLAAPASTLALKESDCLPQARSFDVLNLPHIIWTVLSHRRDPRFLIRFWDNLAALEDRGVHIVPDSFTALCAWRKKESLYLSDDAKPSLITLTGDFVSAAWQDVIDTTEPCYVERGDKTFQRFRLGPEPELTIHTRDDGAFEVEHGGILACVVSAPEENREQARMLCFWFWDLTRDFPNRDPHAAAELVIEVGESLSIRSEGSAVITTVPRQIRSGDSVEEYCAASAVAAVEVAFGIDGRKWAQKLLDQRLANPLYRHQRATDDPTLLGFGPAERAGPTVREAYLDALMDRIGPACIEALNLGVGAKGKEDSKRITAWVWPFVLSELKARLEQLDAKQAIGFCLEANDAVIHRMQSAEFHQAYDETLWASLASFHNQHLDQWTRVQRDALSSRFLLECLVALQPSGQGHVDDEGFEELLSLSASVVQWGYADESIHFGVDDSQVHVLASNRVAISARARSDIGRRLASQQLRSGPRSHLAEMGGAPSIEPVSLQEAESLVDACLQHSFGFSSDDLMGCLGAWVNVCAENAGRVTWVTRRALLSATAREEAAAARVLDALTLGPRPSLLPDHGQDHREILPWVFNRKISLLWRPIAKVGSDYGLAFRQLMEAGEYQIHQLLQGRGPRDGTCEGLISHVNDLRAKALTNAVAHLYSDATRFRVVKNFKAMNVVALPPELGDIDVLVFDRKRGRIEVIEAKNYYLAKTPREIASQHKDLFVTQNGKVCMADRHKGRVAWVRGNSAALLAVFNEKPGRWKIRGFLVMGGFSVHSTASHDVSVLAFPELRERLSRAALSTPRRES